MQLYELAGRDARLVFSPHCWKTRMALAHKGLDAERRPWRFSQRDALPVPGYNKVPVLVDDAYAIVDSWAIAIYLEKRFPSAPALFGPDAGRSACALVNGWADQTLAPALAPLLVLDIFKCLGPEDQIYFRATREKRFGRSLETVEEGREAALAACHSTLDVLRAALRCDTYIGGASPNYADYCVFGMFMWARCVSKRDFIERDDPIHAWRELLLDAFSGMARAATTI